MFRRDHRRKQRPFERHRLPGVIRARRDCARSSWHFNVGRGDDTVQLDNIDVIKYSGGNDFRGGTQSPPTAPRNDPLSSSRREIASSRCATRSFLERALAHKRRYLSTSCVAREASQSVLRYITISRMTEQNFAFTGE